MVTVESLTESALAKLFSGHPGEDGSVDTKWRELGVNHSPWTTSWRTFP
jgi:hypothetical protein